MRGSAERRTYRDAGEQWGYVFPAYAQEGERQIDRVQAYYVLPNSSAMSVLLLTSATLYVCVVEQPFGSLTKPGIFALPLVDQELLAMLDNGMVVVQGPDRLGHHGRAVLDLLPGPHASSFLMNLRGVFESQSGIKPSGTWRERPWTRQEVKAWWRRPRGGYTI